LVLGILGLNPADPRSPEADQVEEDEIDQVQEIIEEQYCNLIEGFKKQKAPKAKPSQGPFQISVKRKLGPNMAALIKTGAGPKGHHGGGFRLDPEIGGSNAFLAEDEIEELTSAISVGPMGHANHSNKKTTSYKREDNKMNQKRDKKEEKRLRLHVRNRLLEFLKEKEKKNSERIQSILKEHRLRRILRNIILEESFDTSQAEFIKLIEQEDPTTDVSDSTGINTLKDFLKNTNVLATVRDVYKTLTTNEDQKKSFRAHIIKWIQDTLAPIKLNDMDPDGAAEAIAEQQMGIDIEGIDSGKFIEADDGSEKEVKNEPEQEEDKMQAISGEDTTGRNKAERVYPSIEKSIIDYYGELDNAEDQEMFYDYLIANMKLYFDKWDNESSFEAPEEPTNDAYNQAKDAEQVPGLSAS